MTLRRTDRPGLRLLPDEVRWDGELRTDGRAHLLNGYLRQHPRRVEDVRRLVPESVKGIRAHGVVRNDILWIERVSVRDEDDPLTDMVLWHALFPGLRAPLVPWWLTDEIAFELPGSDVFHGGTTHPSSGMDDHPEQVRYATFRRGHLSDEPLGSHGSIFQEDPSAWPFWLRLVTAPLLVVFTPAAMVMLYRDSRQGEGPVPWWLALLLPVFFLAIVLKWFAPVTFERHLERHFDRIGNGFRQRIAVQELVDEALDRDLRRSSSNS